jgi:phage baseplate assembly protein W
MADIDMHTGQVIDNYRSALQSVEIIFSTRIGSIVMLREFGAGVVELLGRLMTPVLFATFQQVIGTAIDLWEPRFRVRRVAISGSANGIRLGQANFSIEADWRPRAHLGDFTVESVRNFNLFFLDRLARAE